MAHSIYLCRICWGHIRAFLIDVHVEPFPPKSPFSHTHRTSLNILKFGLRVKSRCLDVTYCWIIARICAKLTYLNLIPITYVEYVLKVMVCSF